MGAASPTGKISRNPGESAGIPKERLFTNQPPTKTETLLQTFSQYASMTNIPAKPTEDEERTENQLNDILEKVPLATHS